MSCAHMQRDILSCRSQLQAVHSTIVITHNASTHIIVAHIHYCLHHCSTIDNVALLHALQRSPCCANARYCCAISSTTGTAAAIDRIYAYATNIALIVQS
eukprot:2271-Heterococcus_DN1.PRE.6